VKEKAENGVGRCGGVACRCMHSGWVLGDKIDYLITATSDRIYGFAHI
jgi:hypothetical protein